MSDHWRGGRQNSRSFSPNPDGGFAHGSYRGRGRGRSSSRGNLRSKSPQCENWRTDSPHDGRRGAKSYDSLLSSSFEENNYDRNYAPRGGRSRGRLITGSSFEERNYNFDSEYAPRGGRSRGRSSNATRGGRGGTPRRPREHPIGFKDLERLLTVPSDAVPLELLRENSGYQLLLNDDTVKDEKMFVLIKVLAYATESKSNRESLYELFNITCEPRFMDKLSLFALSVKRKYMDNAKDFFTQLLTFLNAYSNIMTNVAVDRVPDVVDACITVLLHLKQSAFVSQDLIDNYEALQEMLNEAKQRWDRERRLGPEARKKRREEMDEMEPPDDFRMMSILPTPQDLVKFERPFLRKNITQGKYKDEIHYLDVQFRLLREDFIKPLRNGISDFRGDMRSRFKDIRIYRDVSIIESRFINRKMMHLVKLNLPKHIKSIENSKRLLFGNLLCFSNDNFRTLIFGSVAERDAELYRRDGVIGVQFESDIEDVNFAGTFVMAESRAYFMSYKHVLKALQDMAENGVALTPYIIHVNPNVAPPKYMGVGERYDLRVIKSLKLMKKEEARSLLFDFEDETEELDDLEMPHLREVLIQRDLISWPSEFDLGLDHSQRRALRSALTRELAIIQGPPGTGKTFIGLKLTQILLHNSKVWKNEDHPTPILVVCYTNHALDQFLEGMTPYTKSIVRVGSRTKSEKISRFQVNTLARSLHLKRAMPVAIHEGNMALRNEVMKLENEIKTLRATVSVSRRQDTIFMLQSFSGEGIIPHHLEQQLSQIGLGRWLLLCVNPEAVGKFERQRKAMGVNPTRNPVESGNQKVQKPLEKPKKDSQCAPNSGDKELEDGQISDDEFNDAEEFLKQVEEDRRLGDESDEEETDHHSYNVGCEVTDQMLADEMHLADAAWKNDENDFEAAMKYNILQGQREALEIGGSLPLDAGAAADLEQKPYLNLLRLDFPNRWILYRSWTRKLEEKILKELAKLEAKYQRKSRRLGEIKNQEYLFLMRHASVVGMTTTGAAQYSSVMQDLAPSIVIIEEAAEILESHVITSLTANCKHLIMIGDHQQLRPSATVFELATKFGLDTSLFERMIKNGLAYETLEYQHRMRPTISRLLVPSIYPDLKDHPSVAKHPNIRGVSSNVFFINHDIPEREESDDNNSHENQHEAEFLIGLCKHLMLQGYSPDEVTILTPYSGQFFLLRKLQRNHMACQGVRICVVDNFQGEENNIILLSLVRSNVDGKVGFLRTDNRVCVALSRAKHGMYITGNMDLLSGSSDLWKKIQCDLISDKSFGNSLDLKCENHPDEVVTVANGSDFMKKAPEGGCLRSCNKNLPKCSHTCPRLCHMDDRDHENYKCRVPCPIILCPLDHPCPKQCHETCPPCKVPVAKLCPCNHTNVILCHVDPEHFLCLVPVEKELDHCQHTVRMPCHRDTATYPCPMNCDTRLDCGHQCRLKCHRTRDPDHNNYNCKQTCTKLNAGCSQNHSCPKYCYEDCGNCIVKVDKNLPCGHEAKTVECSAPPESIKCMKKCKITLSCGHACKKLCYQPCGTCTVRVKKNVPDCGHEVLVECGLPPTVDLCEGKCPKNLSCNHPCLERCKDPCTSECKELVVSSVKCPRNHPIKMPCYLVNKVTGEDAWKYCNAPCQQQLNCNHKCKGHCGPCFQGRLHMSCNEPCNRVLVCGHTCKFPCSSDCPPCQEKCNWKCNHSRCRKNCGFPCAFCKEKCTWKCKHQICNKKCGDTCSVNPCQQPCDKKLKCGHACIGFCGDPCPPLCRVCNSEELAEFMLLGFEEDADARFVLLNDCGHSIEVQGLEGWLAQDNGEIGMKTCPRCRKSIYNNRRYNDVILKTYKDVLKVKSKYFTSKVQVKRKDIELLLHDMEVTAQFQDEVKLIMKALGVNFTRKPNAKQRFCNESELKLYAFQAQVLKKATEILNANREEEVQMQRVPYRRFGLTPVKRMKKSKHDARLRPLVKELVEKVMEKKLIMASQMEEEVSCELQRLMVLSPYWNFKENVVTNSSSALRDISVKLEKLMDPTIKFDSDNDKKVRALLKESEQYVGGLSITESERVMIVRAMGLRQGHWYKCPKGHVYCITECGGAMVESNCPDCGSRIGGTQHRLLSNNAVAGEMDGAHHGAWSEVNNLANFNIDNI